MAWPQSQSERRAITLWLNGIKSEKEKPPPPPEWVDDVLLARWAGISLNELGETDSLWVERLRELRYQSLKQGIHI